MTSLTTAICTAIHTGTRSLMRRVGKPVRTCATLVAAIYAAVLITSCSDQPSTAPVQSTPASRYSAAIMLSDSAPVAGANVSLYVQVRQPPATSPIGAFRARIAFDASGLQYLGEDPGDPGLHAVNVTMDTARIAGVAPGAGFAAGRLVALRFRVIDPSALRSIGLILDEIRDLTLADRRSDFTGGHISAVRAARITSNIIVPSAERIYGDATGDSVIDASDALEILTKDVGLTPASGFDSTVADVNVDGLVNALDAQIILASLVGRDVSQFRLGDLVGSPRIMITLPLAPDTLRPGITATITGTHFSSSAVGDTVTIDTVAAVVTAASSTQLTVTVPQNIPCRATHPASVTVRYNGATGHGRQDVGSRTSSRRCRWVESCYSILKALFVAMNSPAGITS